MEHENLTELANEFRQRVHGGDDSKPVPIPTTDADDVIRAQLVENTGTHFLDSGGAYGRHWQENQDNPPWEETAWNVGDGYVTHNVYDFMQSRFGRDDMAVSLEAALYAFAYGDEYASDAWLTCMEAFAESERVTVPTLEALGCPTRWADDVAGFFAGHDPKEQAFTANTYNDECHTLSQVLQTTSFGGPYAEYVMVQVHQGADVRGGYTAPRVYRVREGWFPHELEFYCERCEWVDYESCLYGSDELLYQRTIDPWELQEELQERDDEHSDEEIQQAADEAIEAAHDADHIDGAVFHVGDGCGGHVVFH